MNSAQTYLVKTLGCKANLADSQRLEADLRARGWVPANHEAEAELCIVNSCTVTDEADRQSRRLASRMISRNPNAVVVMTGCAAEVDPEKLATTRGVAYVVGNSDKSRLVDLVLAASQRARSRDESSSLGGEVLGQVRNYEQMSSRHPMDREWPAMDLESPPERVRGTTRGFLKIQEGCNSFCTYCVIPYGRGPARSLPSKALISRVQEMVAAGTREVVLTGTNLGDYGADWSEASLWVPGLELERLVQAILEKTTVERLRLGSLDPTEITDGLIELAASSHGRLCPHFHVSLQSPLSRILRLMKRKYSSVEVERTLQKISARLPDAFIGMDVITGFPGETSTDFEATVQALERLPWTRLHVFPYSERAGTPATRLPGSVAQAERLLRARRLSALSQARQRQWVFEQKKSGWLGPVLFERPARWGGDKKMYWSGYTPNYLRVLFAVQPEGDDFSYWNQQVAVRAGSIFEDSAGQEMAIEVLEIKAL
ncbi:MAG: tRNA (N(6)-L-threonylcarbamoyladenosine(37)-C(2))-methylthiotransferase MtaB [Oligoflexia bacterium]